MTLSYKNSALKFIVIEVVLLLLLYAGTCAPGPHKAVFLKL